MVGTENVDGELTPPTRDTAVLSDDANWTQN